MSNSSKSHIKYIPVSPKKVNRIASSVRNRDVFTALSFLRVLRNKSAHVLYKAIYSAFSNFNGSTNQNLIFKKLLINPGPLRKRFKPRARGRMYKIIKPTTHIYVEIMEDFK